MTHKKSRFYAANGVAKTRYAARYLTFVAILLMLAISATAQIVVNPSNAQGWNVVTTTGGTVGFAHDANPPAGIGALNLTTINDNNSRSRYTRDVIPAVPLSSPTQIGYWSKTNYSPIAEAAPSFSLHVYLDGTPATAISFNYEPYWQNSGSPDPAPVVPNTWQQWDVDSGLFWPNAAVNAGGACSYTNGAGGPPFYTISQISTACPSATIVGISVYMGSYNPAWNTYVDLVTFGSDTWNFEPNAVNAVYNAMFSPLAVNYASYGFQATSTREIGDYVHLAGTNRALQTVSVTMSDWALKSTPANVAWCSANPSKCNNAGFKHPITVNIYNTSAHPNAGVPIATLTEEKFIPWRPEADPTCANPAHWRWPVDNNCYGNGGMAFDLVFDMSSLNTILPNDVIVGIAYNTETYGATPLGIDGPYNSLNVSGQGSATIGTDDNADNGFWDSTYMGRLPGFREDVGGWAPYGTFPFKITALPVVRWVDNSDGQAGPVDCSGTDTAHMTIGAAVAAASDDDIVRVCPGTYNESPLINKSLTIQSTGGRNVTTIQLPPGSGNVRIFNSAVPLSVTIDGFTVQGNDGTALVGPNNGIRIDARNGHNTTIINNRIKTGLMFPGGPSSESGIGLITTSNGAVNMDVLAEGNIFEPLTTESQRAFYMNPGVQNFTFRNNQILGRFVNGAITQAKNGLVEGNTVTGDGTSGGLGTWGYPNPASGNGKTNFVGNTVTGTGSGISVVWTNDVSIIGNALTGNVNGIRVYSTGSPDASGTIAHFNRIANNSAAGILNETGNAIDAENNWWGCNYGSGVANSLGGCPVAPNGIAGAGAASVDADPWLTLTSSASAPVVVFSGTSNVNSALTMNSLGADTSGGGNVPNGTPATYVATLGTAAPNPSTTTAGLTQTVFTAGVVPGAGGVATTVDGQTLNVPIGVYANLCATVSTPVLTSLPNIPISIPINIDETSGRGIIGVDVTLTYETDTLNPGGIGATLGPVASGAGYHINTSTPGTIVISIFSGTPFSGAGTLINLNFLNTGGIGNSTPLTLSGLVLNGTLVCGTTTSGSLTIISGNMTGKVKYENTATPNYPVPNVNLNAPGPPAVAGITDVNGDYTLSGFGAGPQTVTPSKVPMNWLASNGIFSNDASDISKYVVGLISLNPVQLRAAKVSGNATPFLSSFDAALIAQWIVGIPNPINKTGTWTFTNTSNTYPNVDVNITGQDYLALLLGDVTGDWATGPLARPAARGMMPSENAVRASVDASEAEKGSIVNIPFKIENLKSAPVTSYQFDIEYDPNVLEADRVAATVEETVSSGLSVVSNAPKPGLLKVVVFGALPVTSDGVYVNLKFAAIGEIGSRSPINIRGFRFNDGSAETTTADSEVVVTAAKNIGIKGRLLTAMGEPVAADVTLSALGKRGVVGTTRSGADGRFEFGGLDVGRTYTIKVRSKEYRFEPVIVSYADNAVNLDLIALP